MANIIQDQQKTTPTSKSGGKNIKNLFSKRIVPKGKPGNAGHKEALAGVRWRTLNERVEKNEEVSRRLRPPSHASPLVFFPGTEGKEEKRGSGAIKLGRHVNNLISQSGRKRKGEESQYSKHVNKKTPTTKKTTIHNK